MSGGEKCVRDLIKRKEVCVLSLHKAAGLEDFPLRIVNNGKWYDARIASVSGAGGYNWHVSIWKQRPEPGWYYIGQCYYSEYLDDFNFQGQHEEWGEITAAHLIAYIDSYRKQNG